MINTKKYPSGLALQKSEAVVIAKQLCYPKEVILAIRKAKSETEITHILTSARHQAMKEGGYNP